MEGTVSRPTGFTGFDAAASAPPNDVEQQQQQPSSATVGPARAASKNKNLNEEDFVQSSQAAANVSEGRMPEITVPEGDDSWRAYYEHPLTAATTAMLNINGAPEEQSSGIGMLYEYYKLPPMNKGDKLPPLKYTNITDIWSTQPSAVPSVDVAVSAAPGGSPCSGGGEEQQQQLNGGGPTENGDAQHETSAQDVVIYLNQTAAASSSPDASSVKREPEDLTNSGRRPELSGDAADDEAKTGDDGASCCIVIVKQEPEDSPDAAVLRSPPTPRSPQLSPDDAAHKMAFPVQAFTMAAVAYDSNGPAPQYSVQQPPPPTAAQFATTTGAIRQVTPSYGGNTDYYREYVTAAGGNSADYYAVRQQMSYEGQDVAFVERYMRQGGTGSANGGYKGGAGLTVDLPSPDSGIGEAAITPRDSAGLPQMFDYSELSQNQMVTADPNTVVSRGGTPNSTSSTRRPWHDFSRSSEAEKIQIPKIFSNVGFRYYLESPISTSQRREDDRITYINKGQFYGISLEYIPDPDKPLKSLTVKSVVLLVFREEKSSEDEMKAWQFWHSRQHSVKQRILDADTKNSTGLVGCIEEMTHNAIAVYWNPMDGPAKINVAVQCLSTDFSNQKGVKGLPLHLQIDTYEDGREPLPPVHRGYCQIKVFCDKGAERKTRDEERRAAKRKLTVTGRKKMDELYHSTCDRSEFYAMSDLMKPPMLFSPTEDLDKITSMELNFYNSEESPTLSAEKKLTTEAILQEAPPEPVFTVPPLKKAKMSPPNDRVMLYIRQDDEEVYTPLHLVPPSLVGLANAIENKYKICASDLKHLYKRSKKGITVRMDDEMIRHYFNEDTFIISFSKLDDGYEVTLDEL